MEKKEKKRKIKDLTPRQATIAFQEIRKFIFDITEVLYLRKEITSAGRIMLAFYRDREKWRKKGRRKRRCLE